MKYIPRLKNEKIIFCDWNWVDPGYGYAWSKYHDTIESEFLADNVKISTISPKISTEPLIEHDFPWEKDFFGPYICIIKIGDLWHLYYECFPNKEGKVHDKDSLLCLAQSRNGINWTKPKLEIKSWDKEYLKTNILYGPDDNRHGVGAHGICVFEDPLAESGEKYKLMYEGFEKMVCALCSQDGIRWRSYNDDNPIVRAHADSQNVIYYDDRLEKYVGYFRMDYLEKRMIGRSETRNFSFWPDPEIIVQTDFNRPPFDDYYTNALHLWPETSWNKDHKQSPLSSNNKTIQLERQPTFDLNRDRVFLMFPSIYHRKQNHVDTEVWVSRNGKQWQEHKSPLIPIEGQGSNGFPKGRTYFGKGLWETRETKNTLPMWNFPVMKYGINHGVKKSANGKYGNIHSAQWEKDRIFGITNEFSAPAEFWTPIFELGGKSVQLNAMVQQGGYCKMGLWDNYVRKEIPGFTIRDFDSFRGDIFYESLSWNGEYDLSMLDDVKLRLRVKFQDAFVFSLKISA